MPLPVRWKQVKDPRGHWYDAKIVGERGEGEEREVKVHYHGWKQSLDEWILASSDRILDEDEELPEEAHEVTMMNMTCSSPRRQPSAPGQYQ